MIIDWQNFTPLNSLAGGLLIGLAVALMLFWLGRITGISGIVSGLLQIRAGDTRWRAAFIIGLLAAPMLWLLFSQLPPSQLDASWPVLLAAGLLVGFGTRLGSGCTSGHGVCGLSRLSPRSIAATLTFMGFGFATVYVMRHLLA
ncbi:MAG: hypothetical protein H6R01_55 [Burkholderiaceae bacterium]|nr:hypothetical protein [Burkholderiaceae bacterium]